MRGLFLFLLNLVIVTGRDISTFKTLENQMPRPIKPRGPCCANKNRRCRGGCVPPVLPNVQSFSSTTRSNPTNRTQFRQFIPGVTLRHQTPKTALGSFTGRDDRAKSKARKSSAKAKKHNKKSKKNVPPQTIAALMCLIGVPEQDIPEVSTKSKHIYSSTTRTGKKQAKVLNVVLEKCVDVMTGGDGVTLPSKRGLAEYHAQQSSTSSSSSSSSRTSSSTSSSNNGKYKKRRLDSTADNDNLSVLEAYVKDELAKQITHKEKVRYISYFVEENTKDRMSYLLNYTIDDHLWRNAHLHAKEHGPGAENTNVRVNHRMTISDQKLEKFITVLFNSTHRDAFGYKLYETCNGDVKKVPTLMRTKKVDDIFCEYLQNVLDEIDTPEDQCPETNAKGQRCLKCTGHEANHNWTPKDAIGRSTALSIMAIMTPKEIVSLAGLDDIATTCGYLNYKRLRSQIDLLAASEPLMTEPMQKKCTDIVNESESFFKREFLDMLTLDNECIHLCMRGGFTKAPEVVVPEVVVANVANVQEIEEEEEEEVIFPTPEEMDPEKFTGTEDGDGSIGYVFRDNEVGAIHGNYVFKGVDEFGECLYNKICQTKLSISYYGPFDKEQPGFLGNRRTIKGMFFGTDGGSTDFEFLGKGMKGVKAAQQGIKDARAALKNNTVANGNNNTPDVAAGLVDPILLMKRKDCLVILKNEFQITSDNFQGLNSINKAGLQAMVKDKRANGHHVEVDDDVVPLELTQASHNEQLKCTHGDHTTQLQQMVDIERVFAFALDCANKYVATAATGDNNDVIDASLEIQAVVKECKQTFKRYLGHMVRSKREEVMRKERRADLKEGEAIITCDWKMKLLSMMFREGSKEWYGKKGICCIGLMVLQRVPADINASVLGKSQPIEDHFMVSFYDLITDDPKQCAYAVACAKMKVLSSLRDHVQEELRIHTVYQEEDGAGCFSGVYGRNVMRHYNLWTLDVESNRSVDVVAVSFGEPQTNKSFLDTHFAYIGAAITKGVTQSQGEAVDAKTCTDALNSANLRSSSCQVFQPDRTVEVEFKKNDINFKGASYTKNVDVVINDTRYQGTLSRNYGLGPWEYHSKADLDQCYGAEGIVCPRCKDEAIETTPINTNNVTTHKMPMLKKDEEYKKRKKKRQASTAEKAATKTKTKLADQVANQKAKGIFRCDLKDTNQCQCTEVFITKKGLAGHKLAATKQNHHGEIKSRCYFPTRSLKERTIDIASNIEKCVNLGSRNRVNVNANKSFAPVTVGAIKPSLPGYNTIFSNTTLGQYRKKAFEKLKNKNKPSQLEYLQRQYNIGVNDKTKRQPLSEVCKQMGEVRIHGTGCKVFNRREENEHGIVMEVTRMKQWFSQTKAKQGTTPITPRLAYWKAIKIARLREYVGGNTDSITKLALAKTMVDREVTGNTVVGFVNGVYYVTPPPILN